MPGGDRTGPMGYGPMTGRAAGYCAGYPAPGYMNPVPGGRGFGWGGRGRGWRNWYYATGLPGWARAGWRIPAYGAPGATYGGGVPLSPAIEPEQEMDLLKREAEMLGSRLDEIQRRIQELEKGEKTEQEHA
ncbi:MAG: DUF5320 domain-containing protein [Spirochaetota bacterium]